MAQIITKGNVLGDMLQTPPPLIIIWGPLDFYYIKKKLKKSGGLDKNVREGRQTVL